MTRADFNGISRNAYRASGVSIAFAGSRCISTTELREMRGRLPDGLCHGVDAELERRQVAAAYGAEVIDCDDCGHYGPVAEGCGCSL